jgi:transcriptional regulator with XRE-family HTH domain
MQPSKSRRTPLTDDEFRDALRRLLSASGRSARSLSLAMGRDAGYVSALLDPTRPSRARPTPDDLLALSDAIGIPILELLEALWGIPAERLAGDLARRTTARDRTAASALAPADQALLDEFAAFLLARRSRPAR